MKNKRKSPIRHRVKPHTRKGRTVREHARGQGQKRLGAPQGQTKMKLPILSEKQAWDKAFDKFTSEFDTEIEEVFGDNPDWNRITESIGRIGGKDYPVDHEEEIEFYINSENSSKRLKTAARKLHSQFM